MFSKVAVLLTVAVVGVALAMPSDPYGPPKHQPVYKEEPIPYNFAYGVQDEYAGTDFGHNEDSDGQSVKGSYTVQLPDGRKQTAGMVMALGVGFVLASDLYVQPKEGYKEEPIPYKFAYGVQDEYEGSDFGHAEDSDGNTVRGTYTVQLPDGRKQTVSYEADHARGFIADVSYSGKAQYPHEYGPAITFKPEQQSYQPQSPYN